MDASKNETKPFRSGLSGGGTSSSRAYDMKISATAAPFAFGCRLSKRLLWHASARGSSIRDLRHRACDVVKRLFAPAGCARGRRYRFRSRGRYGETALLADSKSK